MAVLCDRDLLRRIRRGLIQPWFPGDERHVQPASIDVHLGDELLLEQQKVREFHRHRMPTCGYEVAPGEFLLGTTQEVVHIPEDCVGDFVLRSTIARAGLNHALSGLLDPGFEGQVTLELQNWRRYWSVRISPGMRIGQIVLHRLSGRPRRSYAQIGNYQGQRGATPSNYNF